MFPVSTAQEWPWPAREIPPQIAFAIALLIKNLHDEGKVPLKEFGSMINEAMAMMLEEGVKI